MMMKKKIVMKPNQIAHKIKINRANRNKQMNKVKKMKIKIVIIKVSCLVIVI